MHRDMTPRITPLPGKRGFYLNELQPLRGKGVLHSLCRAPHASKCLKITIENDFQFFIMKPGVVSDCNFKACGCLGSPAMSSMGHPRDWHWLQSCVRQDPSFVHFEVYSLVSILSWMLATSLFVVVVVSWLEDLIIPEACQSFRLLQKQCESFDLSQYLMVESTWPTCGYRSYMACQPRLHLPEV